LAIHAAFSRSMLAAAVDTTRRLHGKACHMRKLLIIGSLIAPLALGAGFAQTTTPTAPPASKGAAKSTAAKPRTETSLECSKRADAQNLHGKERKKFRASCKKELLKKG
jgi:hypothetical protein